MIEFLYIDSHPVEGYPIAKVCSVIYDKSRSKKSLYILCFFLLTKCFIKFDIFGNKFVFGSPSDGPFADFDIESFKLFKSIISFFFVVI